MKARVGTNESALLHWKRKVCYEAVDDEYRQYVLTVATDPSMNACEGRRKILIFLQENVHFLETEDV